MNIFEKILCPIDFSENSIRALQWTEFLAQRFQSQILALHVLEYPGGADSFAFDFDAYQQRTIAEMHDFLLPLKSPHQSLVITGSASHEIVSVAKNQGASLIVMGTRGLKGLSHHILGSTTEQVIHHAGVPVFTVSPNSMTPHSGIRKHRVLLPTASVDKPPRGYIRLRRILDELQDSVTLLHVVDFKDPMFGVNYSVHPLNVTAYEMVEKEKSLLQAGALMVSDDSRLKAVVRFGNPGEAILCEESTNEYDLVLMPVRKEGLLGRSFNSTAYHVICNSTVPVITFKLE